MQRLRFKCLRLGERFLRSKASFLFLPLSYVWSLVQWLRNALYDAHIFSTTRVSRPVISVGNIAVGGSGKTPLVLLLAKKLRPFKIAVLSRGYGVSHGFNDEMRIISRHAPWVRQYAGKNRAKLAQQAVDEGAEVIILDDGFQHRKLGRDFDFVVVAKEDLSGRCLPAGLLREPPRALNRATGIFSYSKMLGTVALEVCLKKMTTLCGKEIPSIAGEKVGIFCGIGNPKRFQNTVESLGAEVVRTLFLADHEPIQLATLASFYEQCSGVKWIVCTEKDAVKLQLSNVPVLVIAIELAEPKDVNWQKFIENIQEKILK